MNYLAGVVIATCAFAGFTAHVQAVEVPFEFRVPSVCVIEVVRNGVFGLSPGNLKLLDTAHGSNAFVSITANTNLLAFGLTLPDNFAVQPPAANIQSSEVSFASGYWYLNQTTRSSNFRHQVQPGTVPVEISMAALYNNINAYPAGLYRAVIDVTCEAFDPENPGENIILLPTQ